MHKTINTIQDILLAVGMQMNAKKAQIYQWSSRVVQHAIQGILVQPPALVYLGHHIAHRSYQKPACHSTLQTADGDLTSYHGLPLNPQETTSLVNVILLPAWQCRYMFVMDDHKLGKVDAAVQKCIVKDAKGMEEKRDSLKMVTRVQMGGMGLRQIYRSWRSAYVTTVQSMLQEGIGVHKTCIADFYVEILHQTGGRTPL